MIIFRRLWLYYNTLRFLRISQICYYVLFYFKKHILNELFIRQVSKLYCKQSPSIILIKKKPFLKNFHNLSERSFDFLNKNVRFQSSISWNDNNLTKLWLYNLHYFDYLIPLGDDDSNESFNTVKSIVLDWVNSNPVGYKNGWEPYPLSLRIVNWIFFYHYYYEFFKKNNEFQKIYLKSLFQQCAYLSHFLEFHLMANHLFKNGKALLVGGLFFDMDGWIIKGEKILTQELREQILLDGGHFERSPMYHSIVLEDILDLLNFISAKKPVPNQLQFNDLKSIARKMLIWLDKVIQPDLDIPLFGDSAFAIAIKLDQLMDYYQKVCNEGFKSDTKSDMESLDSTGYYIFRSSDQYLIVDGGKLGAEYQPGHAHCDLFSFEYSYRGKRFIVDSGPGEYLNTDLRQKSRSIYSHNCVVVNRLEQAEIWQTFRMGRRIKPEQVKVGIENEYPVFDGTYRNNLSHSFSYLHQRKIRFVAGKFFAVIDNIEAKRINNLQSLIHIHCDCSIELIKDALKITQGEDTICILFKANHFSLKIDDWNYIPEFGILMNSQMIVFEPKDLNSVMIPYLISPIMYFEDARNYFNVYYSNINKIN